MVQKRLFLVNSLSCECDCIRFPINTLRKSIKNSVLTELNDRLNLTKSDHCGTITF